MQEKIAHTKMLPGKLVRNPGAEERRARPMLTSRLQYTVSKASHCVFKELALSLIFCKYWKNALRMFLPPTAKAFSSITLSIVKYRAGVLRSAVAIVIFYLWVSVVTIIGCRRTPFAKLYRTFLSVSVIEWTSGLSTTEVESFPRQRKNIIHIANLCYLNAVVTVYNACMNSFILEIWSH